jgi:hypothetical protein
MRKLLFFSLLLQSISVFACPGALRYSDSCHPIIIQDTVGLSVYSDYNDKKCTKPLLYDGVCPDYLVGGCAAIGECDFIKPTVN